MKKVIRNLIFFKHSSRYNTNHALDIKQKGGTKLHILIYLKIKIPANIVAELKTKIFSVDENETCTRKKIQKSECFCEYSCIKPCLTTNPSHSFSIIYVTRYIAKHLL